MKKAGIIIFIVLLLCCCFSIVSGVILFGHFEANGKCIYRGPFAATTGSCINPADDSNILPPSTTPHDQTGLNNGGNQNNPLQKTYLGSAYSLNYPSNFSINDSDPSRLFVYAANESDNLNISSNSSKITVNQSNCKTYAQQTIDDLSAYDAIETNVDVVKIGNLNACQVDFTADYGTSSGRIKQTQYYVSDSSKTFILTTTINDDPTNFDLLDKVAQSFTVPTGYTTN